MSKFTSFHLRSGQLFYSKTGRAVPSDVLARMHVGKKGVVYRDGRKVGNLRQKTISDASLTKIKTNIKTGGPRVKKVKSGGVITLQGIDLNDRGTWSRYDRIDPSAVFYESRASVQSIVNFESAVDELVTLGVLTTEDGNKWVNEYVKASNPQRSEMWRMVHQYYGEEGYVYE